MTLKELLKNNIYSTDKESDHQYFCIYDELFAPFQNKVINLLEVGIATGGSLKLWEDYFSRALIYGVDKIDEIIYDYGDRVVFVKADFKNIVSEFNSIDIAIDDGSHHIEDQIEFIKLIWPKLNKNGIIIIEDIVDIDNAGKFNELGIPYYIVDLRCLNNRWDNVLVILRKWE